MGNLNPCFLGYLGHRYKTMDIKTQVHCGFDLIMLLPLSQLEMREDVACVPQTAAVTASRVKEHKILCISCGVLIALAAGATLILMGSKTVRYPQFSSITCHGSGQRLPLTNMIGTERTSTIVVSEIL